MRSEETSCCPSAGCVEQPVKRGRRQIHVRDAVLGDRLEHRVGIEARQDHLGRAERHGAERDRSGGMGDGRDDER